MIGSAQPLTQFILPIAAALGQRATVIGHGRLPERPIDELIASLAGNGAIFSSDRLPLKIGGQLHAGTFRLSGGVSSQYVSGLLFALPLLSGPSRIELTTPLESVAYVDMTLRTLRESGIRIEVDANDYDDLLFFIQQLALLFFELLDVFGRDVEVAARASSHDRAL